MRKDAEYTPLPKNQKDRCRQCKRRNNDKHDRPPRKTGLLEHVEVKGIVGKCRIIVAARHSCGKGIAARLCRSQLIHCNRFADRTVYDVALRILHDDFRHAEAGTALHRVARRIIATRRPGRNSGGNFPRVGCRKHSELDDCGLERAVIVVPFHRYDEKVRNPRRQFLQFFRNRIGHETVFETECFQSLHEFLPRFVRRHAEHEVAFVVEECRNRFENVDCAVVTAVIPTNDVGHLRPDVVRFYDFISFFEFKSAGKRIDPFDRKFCRTDVDLRAG